MCSYNSCICTYTCMCVAACVHVQQVYHYVRNRAVWTCVQYMYMCIMVSCQITFTSFSLPPSLPPSLPLSFSPSLPPSYLSSPTVHMHVLYHLPYSIQSSKVIQKIPLLQCYRVFDARTKGLDLNYCVGLEIEKDTFYIKAETASDYNHWVPVSHRWM